jgi:hypothetical protein
MQSDFQIKSGVVGGTVLSALINISFHDILTTGIMAFVGATVSFFVSLYLKRYFLRKKRNQ